MKTKDRPLQKIATITKDRLLNLITAGFDGSYITEDRGVRVRCSQCEACVINGLPAHEHGCPNIVRDDDFDDDNYDHDYGLNDDDK